MTLHEEAKILNGPMIGFHTLPSGEVKSIKSGPNAFPGIMHRPAAANN